MNPPGTSSRTAGRSANVAPPQHQSRTALGAAGAAVLSATAIAPSVAAPQDPHRHACHRHGRRELSNATGLIRQGYDDAGSTTVPLIATYSKDAARSALITTAGPPSVLPVGWGRSADLFSDVTSGPLFPMNRFRTARAVDNKGMSQQGEARRP
ncbi:hypothetical protein NKH18_41595 [Streptomyces sp. M10(2022)]